MKTTCELFLRVSLLLLKFRSTLSKGSDRATSPSCCPESGCRDNYFRSCTSYSRSVPFLPRGAGARSHAMAAASTATVLSPLSHSKGGERATSSEWARAGSDTAREGGKEGRAGKRIATSRPSTVGPSLPTATGDRPRPPTLRAAHGPFAFLSFSSLLV